MNRIIGILILVVLHVEIMANDHHVFFEQTDRFFKQYVTDGMVSYKRVKQNFQEIEQLHEQIAAADLSKSSDDVRKAFLINAYNILVIYQVAKYYPLKSPLDQSGFFDKVKHTIAGESMTLNVLEIKKLLQVYQDARIHFVLACAAKSCPPLANFAYKPDQLDKQLDARTVLAINDSSWLKVDKTQVSLSKIFEWYKRDFGTTPQAVVMWINRFRKDKINASATVTYYEYNWALNEQ